LFDISKAVAELNTSLVLDHSIFLTEKAGMEIKIALLGAYRAGHLDALERDRAHDRKSGKGR